MKLKKVVSKLLACAMVVTTVFTGNVTAASAAQAQIIQPLAKYDFMQRYVRTMGNIRISR